jgi:Spy/CpxP family protein refolding chaperone
MKKATVLLLAASLMAGTAGIASADYGRHGGAGWGCAHGDRIERMKEHLGLSDKQVTRIKAIDTKYEPERKALWDKMRANREQMRALMDKGTASDSQVQKIADAQGKIKADMMVLHFKMKKEVDKVLTKEQLEKRQQYRKQYHKHWREHRRDGQAS